MFGHYLSCFARNSLNRKWYTAITVVGLALGIAVATVLTLYVKDELSYDRQWRASERIYQFIAVNEVSNTPVQRREYLYYYKLGELLQELFPREVEAQVSFVQKAGTWLTGDNSMQGKASQVDKTFPALFQLALVEGDWQTTMEDPHNVALPLPLAAALFGNRSALGETVQMVKSGGGPDTTYRVTAVFKVPESTTMVDKLDSAIMLQPPGLMQRYQDRVSGPRVSGTSVSSFSLYVKLQSGVDPQQIEQKLRSVMDERNEAGGLGNVRVRFALQSLPQSHLSPMAPDSRSGNKLQVLMFALLVALIVTILGANFVVLGTIRAVDKTREAGIRKTTGSLSRELLLQHQLESLGLTAIAAVLALVLVEVGVPLLRKLFTSLANVDFHVTGFLWSYVPGILVFALISGLYPAMVYARNRPNAMLRPKIQQGPLRAILLSLQLVLVFMLVLGGVTILLQIRFMQQRYRGFDYQDVYMLDTRDLAIIVNSPVLQREIRTLDGVISVTNVDTAPDQPTNDQGRTAVIMRDSSAAELATVPVGLRTVGADYLRTFTIPLLAGREFELNETEEPAPDHASKQPAYPVDGKPQPVLLNQTAARQLGFSNPADAINQPLNQIDNGPRGEVRKIPLLIIGVIADAQYRSVLVAPGPELYKASAMGVVSMRLQPEAQTELVKRIDEVTSKVTGVKASVGFFPAQIEYNPLVREKFEASVVLGSAVTCMVIAAFSLYALLVSALQQRVKEIGIRKAVGAETASIVVLFLRQFSVLVVPAAVVALPLAGWSISQWLQRFPYRVDMLTLAGSGLLAMVAAFLLVCLLVVVISWRSASAKPVLALRYE